MQARCLIWTNWTKSVSRHHGDAIYWNQLICIVESECVSARGAGLYASGVVCCFVCSLLVFGGDGLSVGRVGVWTSWCCWWWRCWCERVVWRRGRTDGRNCLQRRVWVRWWLVYVCICIVSPRIQRHGMVNWILPDWCYTSRITGMLLEWGRFCFCLRITDNSVTASRDDWNNHSFCDVSASQLYPLL